MVKNPFMLDSKSWDRDKVIDYICLEIASGSFGLETIINSSEHKLPVRSTINLWLAENEALSDKYARAKELQTDYMADEILTIADDSQNDYMTREGSNGSEYVVLDAEHVQRSRLRIDSRKWLMSKLLPKKYGDRLKLDGEIKHKHTVKTIDLSGSDGDD